MAQKDYDWASGGLDELLRDLQEYERQLFLINSEFVYKVGVLTRQNIISSASSNDMEELQDIKNSNILTQIAFGSNPKVLVLNTSQNATYSEFGYGVKSKGFNSYTNLFEPVINWAYDVNNHGYNGWWYKNRSGEWQHSIGQLPQGSMYRAYLKTKQELGSVAQTVFSKIKLGGK